MDAPSVRGTNTSSSPRFSGGPPASAASTTRTGPRTRSAGSGREAGTVRRGRTPPRPLGSLANAPRAGGGTARRQSRTRCHLDDGGTSPGIAGPTRAAARRHRRRRRRRRRRRLVVVVVARRRRPPSTIAEMIASECLAARGNDAESDCRWSAGRCTPRRVRGSMTLSGGGDKMLPFYHQIIVMFVRFLSWTGEAT